MSFKNYITAFFAIGIMGTLGHFLFEWTGENAIVGLFFPVNESTWEHLKLLFFPTLIFSLGEYIFCKEDVPENYLAAVAVSVIYGMGLIVLLFYTISGVIGRNIDFINIAIYYISLAAMLLKKRKLILDEKYSSPIFFNIFAVILAGITFSFIVFSKNPPLLGIFTPPVA